MHKGHFVSLIKLTYKGFIMFYGIRCGSAHRARVIGLHGLNTANRDKKVVKVVSRFAPELVQASKALGMHPATLDKRLKLERAIARLIK
jgi:hypothetical protein